jgi:diphthine synthase
LHIIGLGLYSTKDLTLGGLEAAKKADKVYAELYTSFYAGGVSDLSKALGRKVIELSRSDVEEGADKLISEAKTQDVALLVPGDPMAATTHESVVLRARELGVSVSITHASSIFSAVAETGLQAYKFGKTTTLAYQQENYKPTSPYDAVAENKARGLHTLCLLDVKQEEGRYMTVGEGIQTLLGIEAEKKQGVFTKDTLCVGVARLGSGDRVIKSGKASQLLKQEFGEPPHALIIPGKLHFIEEDALKIQ